MTARAEMVREILIAARVCELRRLANDTTEAYERALARCGMTREHFSLRTMLLGLYAARDQALFLRFDFLAHLGQRFPLNFQYCGPCGRPVVAFARDR